MKVSWKRCVLAASWLPFCAGACEEPNPDNVNGICGILVDFADLNPGNTFPPVPQGYRGMNWDAIIYLDGPAQANYWAAPNGYSTIGSTVMAATYGVDPAKLSAPTGSIFSLVSMKLAPAWSNGVNVVIKGFDADGVEVASKSLTLPSVLQSATVNFDSTFAAISSATIDSSGGTWASSTRNGGCANNSCDHVAIDDIVIVLDPPNTPGVSGDPHFKTWSGQWYDFMGACDLHLVKAPLFASDKELVIDIRTKIRRSYSYVESAVVQIGKETLEVDSFGDYYLNGVSTAELPGNISGYRIVRKQPSEKINIFEIHVTEMEKIVLKSFKDMVSVEIENADASKFQGSLGMMGAYESGLMLASDGKTIVEDPFEFAAEWQVRMDEPMLFQTAQAPQHPRLCLMPSPLSQKDRQLGESFVSKAAAEKACAHLTGKARENCINDCMATGDLDLAAAGWN